MGNKTNKKHFLFLFSQLIIVCIGFSTLQAQTNFGSEEELKKQAAKLFDEEEFEEAFPLYTQLVSLYQKDPVYNYRLGVCMIYAGEDKEQPISFLEYASKNAQIDKEVFYYLGKAYHINYRFDDAIAMYIKYKSIGKPAKVKSLQVDRQIEMCNNGKRLLNNVTDLVVLDKKEMSKAEFFRGYDISSIGGKMLVKPDDPVFKSSVDKKKKEKSIIYLSADNSQVYFSSYGQNENSGKDIYVSRKLPTGEWGKPLPLGFPINTQYDEDYPFLHPNGNVLYFCSKGHNSMGGYDVFKSVLDEKTNTWSAPVNMDFPVNTPDDDIMYVTDKEEKQAYFASARFSVAGKTSVYHVDVQRKPVDVSIVNGIVLKGENNSLDIKIAIKDLDNNTIMGVYNSNPSNGEYKIELPNGGRFLYTIEANGIPTQSESVALPVQYQLKPLKQEISFEKKTNKLIIKNIFDADASETSYLSALNYIKEKSKLDVADANAQNKAKDLAAKIAKAKADSLANIKPPAEVKPDNTELTQKVINESVNEANADAKEARLLKEQAALAADLAEQKSKLADARTKEGKQEEADQLTKESLLAFDLSKKLEQASIVKQQEADLSAKYSENLDKEIKANGVEVAQQNLSTQKKELDDLSKQNQDLVNIDATYKNNLEVKEKEFKSVKQDNDDLRQEIADNETLIKGYEADIEKTNKKDVKQGLENQIAALKKDNEEKQAEIQSNEAKEKQAEKEYLSAKSEMDLVSSIVTNKSIAIESTTANSSENKNTTTTVASTQNPSSAASTQTSVSATNKSEVVESPPMLKNIDTKYNDEIAQTSSIGNEAEREAKKSEILINWAKAIEDEVYKKKMEYISTSDPKVQKQLTNEILASETLAKQKREESKVVLAKAKELAKNQPVTTNTNTNAAANNIATTPSTTNNNSVSETSNSSVPTAAVYNEKRQQELNSIEGSSDNLLQKEEKKYEIYKNWIQDITNEIAAKKSERAKTNDPEKLAGIEKQIADLQNTLGDKESIMQAVAINVESIREQQAIAGNNEANTNASKNNTLDTTAPTTTPTNSVQPTDTVQKQAPNTAQTNNNTINTNTATNTNNTSASNTSTAPVVSAPITSESIFDTRDKATAQYKEANDLINQANELKSKAADIVDLEERNKVYADAEDITKQAEEKQLRAAALDAEANKMEYTQYFNNIEKIAKQNKNPDADDVQIAELMFDESNTYFDNAQKQREKAKTEADFYTKNELLIAAKDNETKAIEKQKQAFDIYKKYNPDFVPVNSSAAIASNTTPTNTAAASNATSASSTAPAVNNNVPEAKTVNAGANNAASTTPNNNTQPNNTILNTTTSNSVVELAPDEKFETRSTPVYSAAKPIPIDEKLPEGLVFKVQIGAFKNAIRQDLFEGITPITGESTPQGLTRYTAGLFKKFTSANKVKGTIQNLGYKDAFVVAFFNGKRISMSEALAMSGESITANNNAVAGNNVATNNPESSASNNALNPTTNNATASNTPLANATKIDQVQGLFYTVQVGVYSQPVTPDKIYNIQPLYSEITPTGNYRYTTGMFNNVDRAVQAKNSVVSIGVRDAFVAAYNKGKRLTLAEALQIEKTGTEVFASSPDMNRFPTFSGNTVANNSPVQPITNNNSGNNELDRVINQNNQITSINGVIFKVQIGAYRNEIPLESVNQFLQVANKGINTLKNAEGITIYTIGNYKNYDEANRSKNEIVASGLQGAFVVAFNNGNKISVEEAKRLTEK